MKSMMCCSRVMCCARCVVVALSESRDVFLRIVFEAEALRAWDAAGLCPAPNAAEIVTPRDDAPAEGVNAEEKSRLCQMMFRQKASTKSCSARRRQCQPSVPAACRASSQAQSRQVSADLFRLWN